MTDPVAVAAFCETALGYVPRPSPEGFAGWEDWLTHYGVPREEWRDSAYLEDAEGVGPSLSFRKVPESKAIKNRLLLDVQVGGGRNDVVWEIRWPRVSAEADRLVAAGATVLNVVSGADGRPDDFMMADPERNEFCIL